MPSNPFAAVLEVVEALEQCNVPYAVGGSLASGMHGEARSTKDADLLVALPKEAAPVLVEHLRDRFYIDPDSVVEATGKGGTFNVIHLESMQKVDLYVCDPAKLPDRNQINRRILLPIGVPGKRLFFTSPEDIILRKLTWFRLGGEMSERQWRDVQGVLKVQKGRLDQEYLETNARSMGVEDLLRQAYVESGFQSG